MSTNEENNDTIKKIKNVIKEKIRPMLAFDGGDIEFIDFQDGCVQVKLMGACHGCPMATITLKHGVESLLKQEVPEVASVEALDLEEDDF